MGGRAMRRKLCNVLPGYCKSSFAGTLVSRLHCYPPSLPVSRAYRTKQEGFAIPGAGKTTTAFPVQYLSSRQSANGG